MDTYSHCLYDKKELGVYRRVPGSSDQNTDLFAFGEHPNHAPIEASNTAILGVLVFLAWLLKLSYSTLRRGVLSMSPMELVT